MIQAISAEHGTGGGGFDPSDRDNGRPAATPATPTAVGVVDYAGRAVRPGPQWHRGPDGLVLMVPPPPAWRRLVAPAAVLGGATALAVGPAVLATALPADPGGWPVVLLLGLTTAGLWVLALRRLLRAARNARLPSTVRADAGTLSMTIPGSADERLQWPREQVRDVRVTATGVLPAVQEYLWVRVERQPPDAGPATVTVVRIPWAMPLPAVGLVAEIEGALRDAVGLPPVRRGAPAGG